MIAALALVLALQAGEDLAETLPLGGDFRPDPVEPVFVAVGHGGRILVSRDDGRTWTRTFYAGPGSDHGPWATKAVAYAGGVFVVPMGWGARTVWLASDDGATWRHLTAGDAKMPVKTRDNPRHMPMTWAVAGGKGAVVGGGYMTMTATPDLGRTFAAFSLRSFKKDPRPRSLVTHHVRPVYCGDATGRFLALGQDRAKENAVFGNLFASDDLGKTWAWMEPELLNAKCGGFTGIASNGTHVVIVDKAGKNAFRSADAGETWEGPFATGTERGTLSLVGKAFWLVGKTSRASADGKAWRDLPGTVPAGTVVASEAGTLVSVDRRRYTILRSADGGETWRETYRFEPNLEGTHGAQGLRAIAYGRVRKP